MPVIELPNGQHAEFPDNMPLDQIKAVLRQKFPAQPDQQAVQQPQQQAPQDNSDDMYHAVTGPLKDAALGFGQGLVNVVPGVYNLAASGVNALGGNLPKSPMLNVAPDTLSSKVGEIGSFFAGPGLFKAASKLPEVALTARAMMRNPMISEGVNAISNLVKNHPLASSIAGNALLGGAYAPDNQVMGMALGGAAPLIGKGLSSAWNVAKPFAKEPSNLFTSNQDIKNMLLKKHDELEKRASDAYDYVSNEVGNRGISRIPMTTKYMTPGKNLSKEFIEGLQQYLPNSRQNQNLIKEATKGNYNALRKLQTDMYTRGKKNLTSNFEADRLRGSEMLEKRQDINDAIHEHLNTSGHEDLGNILNNANQDWRTLKDVYYNDNMKNSLVKMFDKNVRRVPKNLSTLLSEESIPMNKLREFHPGLDKQIAGNQANKQLRKIATKYGLGPAVVGYEIGKNH